MDEINNLFKLVGSVVLNDEASSKLKDIEKNVGGTESKLGKLGGAFTNVGGKMTSTGKSLTKKVTAPIVGIGTAAMLVGSQYETSMSSVQAISGATGEDMEKLRAVAREMGATTRYSASESADALGYMALAGWDVQQMTAALPDVLNLATAGQLDLAAASDIVTDMMSMFGMEATEAGRAADVFAAAQSNSNTNVEQLSEALINAGPAAAAVGYELEETSAILGIFADNGIKGGRAGTTLNAMLRDVQKNAEDGAVSIGKTSVAVYDAEGNMRSMSDIVQDVEKATKGMSDEQRNAALSGVFQQQSLSGVNLLLTSGTEGLIELEKKLDDSSGSAEEMAEIMDDNMQGSLLSMKSALEDVGISFFEMGEGPMRTVIDKITEAVRWFGELDPSIQQTIGIVAMLVAAIGPVLIVLGSVFGAIGKIITVVKTLIPIFKAVGLVIGGVSAPVLAVIAAIAALIAIGVALWKNWDTVKEVAGNVFGWIKDFIVNAFETVTGAIGNALDWITENVGGTFGDVAEVIKEYLNMAWENIKLVWDFIKETFSNALEFVKALVSGDFEGMKEIIKNQLESAKELIFNIWENIKEFFGGKLSEILEDLKEKFHDMFLAIGEKLGLSEEFIEQTWDYIKGYFQNVLDFLKALVSGDFEGMKNAITNAMSSAKEFLSNVWEEIKLQFSNKINEILGNVRTKFEEIKEKIMTPIRNAKDKVTEFIENIKTTFTEGSQGILNTVREKFEEIKEKILNPIEAAKNKVKQIVEDIKGFFSNMKLKIPDIPSPKMPKMPEWVGNTASAVRGSKLNPVNWNAEGGIFDSPTIFNTDKGLQGVGEAGPEAIMPLGKLRDWIGEWVRASSNDKDLVRAVDRVGKSVKSSSPVTSKSNSQEYNVTINMDGTWVVDTDERAEDIINEMDNRFEKILRSRGEK